MLLKSNSPLDQGRSVPQHNLFFAIMAPPCAFPLLARESAYFQRHYSLQSTPIQPDRWHISLKHVFRGTHVPQQVVDFSRIVGGAVRFEQFDLRFDMAMSYRNSRIKKPFVVCGRQPARHADRLVRHMDEAFSALSGRFRRSARKINPHITLSWDETIIPPQSIDFIDIPVTEIALVHSQFGRPDYEIAGRWPLVS